ncbi:hypothetical protein LNV09_24695, partial [Paucibacter sp. B2R-40]|uniref:hypothetical protein n=1 Tax=Paucibacter sp. B2R-40 TaxID=2893554 RepID=UPI0021E4F6D3
LNVTAGVLSLGVGSSLGTGLNIASNATLSFSGGTHELTGLTAASGTGNLHINGAVVNATGVNAFNGQIQSFGGTLNVDGGFSAASLYLAGGTVTGAGALTVGGPSTWSNGAMTGAGSTTFSG